MGHIFGKVHSRLLIKLRHFTAAVFDDVGRRDKLKLNLLMEEQASETLTKL